MKLLVLQRYGLPHTKIMNWSKKMRLEYPPPLTLSQKNYFKITPWFQTVFRGESPPPIQEKIRFGTKHAHFFELTIYHAKIQHFQILCRPSPVIPHFWNVCNVVLSIYIGLYLYYQFIYLIHAQGRSLLTMHSCRNLHEFVSVIWNVYVGMHIEIFF